VYRDTGLLTSTASDGEAFLIEVDAAEAQRLERHIRRYRLRAQVSTRLLEADEVSVWHAWEDDSAGRVYSSLAGVPPSVLTLQDPRAPALGSRILAPRDELPAGIEADEAPESAYQIRRYLWGVPEGQAEILRDSALPLESNMDVMGGIDFHKGCYVGQELTIRTRHRGVVRKRVLPCVLYSESDPAPTELAYLPAAAHVPPETSIGRVGKKGRSAGKWLHGVGNLGLALCRLEIMTDLALPGEMTTGSAYNPDDEFVLLQDQHNLKIKAFVPSWLRAALEQTHQIRDAVSP
jgi:folate-binding protein YgfZ